MTREIYGITYELYFIKTANYLVRRGIPPDQAEELAQDAWVRGWEITSRLKDPGEIHPIIKRIALYYTQEKKHSLRLQDIPQPQTPRWNQPPRKRVNQALNELNKVQRRISILYFVDDMPQREIAEKLGLSLSSVRGHIHQARIKLRAQLSESSTTQ